MFIYIGLHLFESCLCSILLYIDVLTRDRLSPFGIRLFSPIHVPFVGLLENQMSCRIHHQQALSVGTRCCHLGKENLPAATPTNWRARAAPELSQWDPQNPCIPPASAKEAWGISSAQWQRYASLVHNPVGHPLFISLENIFKVLPP